MHEQLTYESRLTTMEIVCRELQRLNSDHERRIRTLERIAGYGSGAVGMLLFLLKVAKLI